MFWCINIFGSGVIGGFCVVGVYKVKFIYWCFVCQGCNFLCYVEELDGQIIMLEYVLNDSYLLSDFDLLIMLLKVFQFEDVFCQWQGKISLNMFVLLLYNGMGGVELVRDIIFDNLVLLVIISYGVLKLNVDIVKYIGLGVIMFGMVFYYFWVLLL